MSMNVNNLFVLTHFHLFLINSGYTHCKYKAKTGNIVSEYTHSNLHTQILLFKCHFIDIWYTFLTSVHYNLEHGLAIVTESFSPLNLDHTTSFVKVWIRSHAMLFLVMHTSCLSKPVWTGLIVTENCQISFVFQSDTIWAIKYQAKHPLTCYIHYRKDGCTYATIVLKV